MPGNHHFLTLKVGELFTRNAAMERCLKLAALAAESDVPVLLLGETGTGKTLLAQAIHNSSARSRSQFVSFNASAMSDTLLESQLFGHEKGAFTGADRTIKGKFELANTGTLFLDEVADMSPLAQAKILRAVEYGEFERLGSERLMHSQARIISATNASLRERIRRGAFREDLYHRLAGLTLHVPALRDRPEDLRGLIAVELASAAQDMKKDVRTIHSEAMERLLNYSWPGNLRELHHQIRTIVLFCQTSEILPEHVLFQPEVYDSKVRDGGVDLPEQKGTNGHSPDVQQVRTAEALAVNDLSLATAISGHIRNVYERCGYNQRETARTLRISRSRLARHLQK